MRRTHHCNQLRPAHAGQSVVLSGWVHSRRDLGGLIFIDVRDREGRTQTVFDPSDLPKELFDRAASLRSECVITVTGKVRARPAGTNNPKIATGEIEIAAAALEVLNMAEVLPFPGGRPGNRPHGQRGTSPAISLPGFAPPGNGPQPPPAQQSRLRHAPVHGRAGLSRSRDAHSFQIHPRRRARISRAQPPRAGHFLRPAAIAAAIQTNAHGRRRGKLLPNRPLLPRRRPARRPPTGIHPARPGNELHRARGHLRADRRTAPAHLENWPWTWTCPRPSRA